MDLDKQRIKDINKAIRFSSLWIRRNGFVRNFMDKLTPLQIMKRDPRSQGVQEMGRYRSVREAEEALIKWGVYEAPKQLA